MTLGEATGVFTALLFIFSMVVDYTKEPALKVFIAFFAFATLIWLIEKIILKRK